MTKRPIYLAYARKSRIDAKTRQEVESTDRQVARLKAWAVEQGVELELFAEPDGYRSGGSTLHRPAYQQLLRRLTSTRPGELAGVVATDLDRTGRLERDMHDLFDEIVNRGFRLIVLDDPSLNLESTDGRFLAGLKVLLAAQERRKVSDRVRTALKDKRARGLHVGVAPYGYRHATVIGEGGQKRKMLVPDPEEAPRLVAILEKYVSGAGIDEVARWCNALGWPTRRGGSWQGGSVYDMMLHVQVYRGFVITRDARRHVASLTVGMHEPLIDEQLAQRVEMARTQRSLVRLAGRKAVEPYPLVHLAVCGVCGSRLVGATVNLDGKKVLPEPRYYYRCIKNLGPCDVPRMPALPLEAQVWTVLDAFRARLRHYARRHDRALLPPPRRLPEPTTAGAIRAEMDRLTLIFQKGRISEERYDHDYALLEDRLAAAIATIETIGSPADPLGLLAVENLMATFDQARETGDRTTLAGIARLMVERVVVCRGDVVRCTLVGGLEMLTELD